MIFYCLIFGSVEAADIHLLNNWLNTLMTIDGHVVSLELSLACPTLRAFPPSNLLEKIQPRGGNPKELVGRPGRTVQDVPRKQQTVARLT